LTKSGNLTENPIQAFDRNVVIWESSVWTFSMSL